MHVGEHATVERRDVTEAGVVHLEAPDDVGLTALENLDDAAFDALLRAPLDARDDPIAVHRLGQIGRGDVDVTTLTVLGHDEPEPTRVRRRAARR